MEKTIKNKTTLKEQYNKSISRALIKDRIKELLPAFFVITIILAILIYFPLSSVVERTEELEGTVVGMSAKENYEGNTVFMTVDLENGKRVPVSIPSTVIVKKGERVILFSQKAKFFGGERYKFKKYKSDLTTQP